MYPTSLLSQTNRGISASPVQLLDGKSSTEETGYLREFRCFYPSLILSGEEQAYR